MGIGLPVPPEPKDIKKSMKEQRGKLGLTPNIDYDSLVIWYLNKFPSYLWKYWKTYLEPKGYTWQRFIKVLKYATSDIIDWALYDELDWRELIIRLTRLLERYSLRR